MFTIEPFHTAVSLRNGHLQTLCSNYLRPTARVSFRRVRLDTPDGDFLDLDFAEVHGRGWAQLGHDAPLVLVLHGLEGNARRGYACELYRQLAQRGIRAVGLNYRSCSGEMNRTWRMYHAGATGDVDFVFHWLDAQYPTVPKGLAGFSLGGNMVLKYLGEPERDGGANLRVGVAISPPFDMNRGTAVLERGLGWFYGQGFVRSLLTKMAAKREIIARERPDLDVERILQVRSLPEFDDMATAPMYGFKHGRDYYAQCGSGRFLGDIERPTLIIRALDDPIIHWADVPHKALAHNKWLTAVLPRFGGHVGFLEGNLLYGGYSFWAERQAARFLAYHLR